MSARITYRTLLLLGLTLVMVSCSVEKNTSLSRNYHNLTSHYNIYFNGIESYKKGVERSHEAAENDYTQILNIFLFEDEGVNSAVSSDMKRAIDKATKVITFHSISAKPKVKEGEQSAKDKAFYEKNEYNKWVDDSYMMMGRSYMYQGEFFLAAETFKHVLLTFPKEDVRYWASVWLARAYTMMGEEREAERLIMALEDDPDFPEDYLLDFHTTRARLYMEQEEYAKAGEHLQMALEQKGNSKEDKIRYTYILAQLYEEAGRNEEALKAYKKVNRYNPPYEMAFNARVSMAEVFESGKTDSDELKKLLNKMLKDSKNKEYQDQIYFALGNIAMEEGNREEAIENYQLSVSTSVQNYYQKGFSSVTLAEIYYEEPDYLLSAAYYDSAVSFLNREYPGYNSLRIRSMSLGTLVNAYNTYELEDSVQHLAALPENELNAVIDGIIEDVIAQEEAERLAKEQAMQDMAYNQGMMYGNNNSSSSTTAGGQWYFYNLQAKSVGQPEFRMKWGDRKLEDNWRRKNRSSMSDIMSSMDAVADTATMGEGVAVIDNKSREYYLVSIPLTDSAMQVSNARMEDALYVMGLVYMNDLLDYELAIDAFEEFLSRFPEAERIPEVYYSLYELYNTTRDMSKVAIMKQTLTRDHPDSHFSKLLNNPNYLKELEEEEMRVTRTYEEIYSLYQAKQYREVIVRSETAIAENMEDPLVPKFEYIRALSLGALRGKEEMKIALDTLVAYYPQTEEGVQAQEIIDYMYTEFPEIREAAEAAEARDIYTSVDSSQQHYFLLVLDGSMNVNQVSFDLLNYHLDYFNEYNLEIVPVSLEDGYYMLAVEIFLDAEAAGRYLESFGQYSHEVVKDASTDLYRTMLISVDNFAILKTEKQYRPYYFFYLERYYSPKQ